MRSDTRPCSPPLIGAWTLLEPPRLYRGDGRWSLAYGEAVSGLLIYHESGFMAAHFHFGHGQPIGIRHAHADDVERFELRHGLAYHGTFSVDAMGASVCHEVLGGPSPRWRGARFTRSIEWDGDTLILSADGIDIRYPDYETGPAHDPRTAVLRWGRASAARARRGG